jgi:hypothetical protein
MRDHNKTDFEGKSGGYGLDPSESRLGPVADLVNISPGSIKFWNFFSN